MRTLDHRIAKAVRHFWATRASQGRQQGATNGRRDRGSRTQATGGKQLDGFGVLVRELLREAGIPESNIYQQGRADVTLPGFFRPTKQWDIVVVAGDCLLASIELKALCGPSFGNNYNNRIEEALGSSTDIWTAYREGIFDKSPQPFIGYVLLLEEADGSKREVRVCEKHFDVPHEFRDASYATRCQLSLRKFVRERCYTAACLLLSDRKTGAKGKYSEPADDLTFERFARSMSAHVKAQFDAIGNTGS